MIDSRYSDCSQGLSICSVFSAIRSDLLLLLRSISMPWAPHTACICFSSAIILTFQFEIMKLSCHIQLPIVMTGSAAPPLVRVSAS
jgi:hypothetical protein